MKMKLKLGSKVEVNGVDFTVAKIKDNVMTLITSEIVGIKSFNKADAFIKEFSKKHKLSNLYIPSAKQMTGKLKPFKKKDGRKMHRKNSKFSSMYITSTEHNKKLIYSISGEGNLTLVPRTRAYGIILAMDVKVNSMKAKKAKSDKISKSDKKQLKKIYTKNKVDEFNSRFNTNRNLPYANPNAYYGASGVYPNDWMNTPYFDFEPKIGKEFEFGLDRYRIVSIDGRDGSVVVICITKGAVDYDRTFSKDMYDRIWNEERIPLDYRRRFGNVSVYIPSLDLMSASDVLEHDTAFYKGANKYYGSTVVQTNDNKMKVVLESGEVSEYSDDLLNVKFRPMIFLPSHLFRQTM